MDSNIVIKVKYGDNLRRFNARVNEAGQLDLDIAGLREKVTSLFNIAFDAEFTLTYVDEDGDIVTLVDEEDLRDVMRQSLNPLRINVQMNAERSGRFFARSSGNSTPVRSCRVQNPLPNLNNGVAEILRPAPEPFCEALSRLALGLASEASSSAPRLTELVENISKMAFSYANPVAESQAGTESSMQDGASGSKVGTSSAKVPDASGPDGAVLQGVASAKFEGGNSENCQEGDVGNVSKCVNVTVTPSSGSLNMNSNLPDNPFKSGTVAMHNAQVTSKDDGSTSKHEVKKFGECHFSGKAGRPPAWLSTKAVGCNPPRTNHVKEFDMHSDGWKCYLTGASPVTADTVKNCVTDSKTMNTSVNTSSKFPAPNLVGKCLANDSVSPFTHFGPRVHPFKRSYNHGDGMSGIFHRGVRCDGCGVHPITGPRFKSIVKEDYDLCSICFSEMGNEADYIRIDRPVYHRHRINIKGLADSHPRGYPTSPLLVRDCMGKPFRPKLDSRFIMDVNVLDGTVMAPRTQFTKIWRMRNNGTTVWPQGSQLVWIGGDKLSDALSAELQITLDGIPVEKELDVAVDFTAPELPGRYISYWRMASPSGQKFGQRVWVLIQVDASLKDTLCDSFQGLNLNLPPESNDITGPESVNVNVEPMLRQGNISEPSISDDKATELVEPLVDVEPSKDLEMNFPINESLLVGGSVSNTLPQEAPTMYPMIDLSDVAPAVPPHTASPSVDMAAPVQEADRDFDVEKTTLFLKELEEMGFKQVDLNKEILRKNDYNLEQSVEDLCGIAEWDPMLEELQEMGFSDKEMNKRLLKKNNGSIKRVVMDLIYGEKP